MTIETPREILIRTAQRYHDQQNIMKQLFEAAEECRAILEQKPETLKLLAAIEQLQQNLKR